MLTFRQIWNAGETSTS